MRDSSGRRRREAVTRKTDQSPTRAAILDVLTTEGVPVSTRRLATLLSKERASLRYHLSVLRDEGLVEIDHVDYLGSHVEHYYRLTRREGEES
jgi:DNA-binding transcriptional ArsR family regulator